MWTWKLNQLSKQGSLHTSDACMKQDREGLGFFQCKLKS
jgi:hypothetical protein